MFGGKKGERLNFLANFYYRYRKIIRAIQIYLILAGPGILVMVADNDAGGITTYADTGLKFGYNLIWFLIILGPIAYFVQEMTVRLGAVTKHGHAEAIFSSFGWFWGWFSFLDLSIVNWLTLITEFIGMTTGLAVFGVPPILTVIIVIIIMVFMILSGRYWTWEKIALVFATINLIYIPLAFVSAPNWGAVLRNGIIPNLPGGFNGTLFFFIMANIGTTIAPWMIFFQQSSVVDKGMKEKDIPFGKLDTFIGAIFTVLVAVFIIVAIHALLPNVVVNTNNLPDAGQTAQMIIQQHSRLEG
jgi:NRAMP (natural resistance-associated macrophage protein)-like metal ion transporter